MHCIGFVGITGQLAHVVMPFVLLSSCDLY